MNYSALNGKSISQCPPPRQGSAFIIGEGTERLYETEVGDVCCESLLFGYGNPIPS